MYTSDQEAAMNYARQAFSVVLDQHELAVPPHQVQAIPVNGGSIVLLYETHEHSATGRFDGQASGGTITLEEVKTPHWKKRFDTVDQFKGSRPDGAPILLAPSS